MINIVNMTLKNKITTLKNLIEMNQMTVNNPKFDVKKLLDSLIKFFVIFSSLVL